MNDSTQIYYDEFLVVKQLSTCYLASRQKNGASINLTLRPSNVRQEIGSHF